MTQRSGNRSQRSRETGTAQVRTWTFGDQSHPDVVKHLLVVSARGAQHSLENYAPEGDLDLLTTAVTTGLALETLLKAVVAKASPLLLLENLTKLDQALFMASIDTPSYKTVGASGVFTIGAARAWEIATKIKGLSDNSNPQKLVFETRNAAAHMGIVERETVHASQRTFITLADLFLGAVGLTREEYFGAGSMELVETVLAETGDDLAEELARKKRAALTRWMTLQEGTAEDKREGILRTLEFHLDPRLDDPSYNYEQTCPVCERQGQLVYDTDYTLDPGWVDENGHDIYIGEHVMRRFDCPVCGLSLQTDLTRLAFSK